MNRAAYITGLHWDAEQALLWRSSYSCGSWELSHQNEVGSTGHWVFCSLLRQRWTPYEIEIHGIQYLYARSFNFPLQVFEVAELEACRLLYYSALARSTSSRLSLQFHAQVSEEKGHVSENEYDGGESDEELHEWLACTSH